jgi:hypothetical protein
MARVFITGSSDGLGRMAAQLLVDQRHSVVLHARNQERGKQALAAVPQAETVVIGDLTSIAQTRGVAEQVNALGTFDAVIHNAGIGYRESRRIATEDGLPHVFAVNTLAPYILTALIRRPKRLVYLSSGLHHGGDASLKIWRGNIALGRDSRLTPTPNCTMCFWPSRSRDAGRMCSRMRWNRVGWPRRWEAPAPRMTLTPGIVLKCGLRSATTRPPRLRANTSITCAVALQIRPRGKQNYKTGYSMLARDSLR